MDYLLFWQDIRNTLGPTFESIVVFISDKSLLIAGILPFILYWVVSKDMGVYTLLNYSLARVLNGIIKVTACIYRPWILDERIKPSDSAKAKATGYSFPSGHVTSVTATSLSIFTYLKKNIYKILLILWIIVVGITRNYLGVHTLKDVLVGLISVIILIFLTKRLYKYLKNNKDKDIKILLIVILLSLIAIIYTLFKSYPISDLVDPKAMQKDTIKDIGALLGFSVGLLLEERYINFNTNNLNIKQVTIRLIIGLVIISIFNYGLNFLSNILDPRLALFISNFLYTLSGTYLVPLIYKKIEKE